MKIFFYTAFIVTAVLFFASCKDPYMPDIKNPDEKVLVVEGYIDGGAATTVKLSYTRMISKWDTAVRYPFQGTVSIENRRGIFYPLSAKGNGVFSNTWMLDPREEYRLHIYAGSDQFVSNFLPLKVAPPIDSVSYDINAAGANFYVSTHDNTNKTTYYRWTFDETWEIHSSFQSDYIYDPYNVKVIPRTPDQMNIRVCWMYGQSKEILIGSSAKYSQDVIDKKPILTIPHRDVRLGILYSMNVRQYALDSLAYNFWSQLKKNTEEVGTIFDPQPNNIRGNITCINDTSRIVVGYVGAGISTSKRTFFRVDWDYIQKCEPPVAVKNNPDTLAYYFSYGGYIPLQPIQQGLSIIGYEGAEDFCVDCTLRGSNVKPPYWP